MAYNNCSWLSVTPTSGNGDGTLEITASAHTGRVARTYGNGSTTGIAVTSGSITKHIGVTQNPKDEFVAFDNLTYNVSDASTKTLTITGKSNSAKLTFTLRGYNGATATQGGVQTEFYVGNTQKGNSLYNEDASNINFVSDSTNVKPKFTVNSVTQCNSSVAISGDPGASSQYNFEIVLNFNSVNSSIAQEVAWLDVVGGSAAISSSAKIIRAAGSAKLNLGSTSVTLKADGSKETVSIDCNSTWSLT